MGVANLLENDKVKDLILSMPADKYIAAICAAPSILAKLGLLNGKRATCHPAFVDQMEDAIVVDEDVVVDGHIITGRALGASFAFAFTLLKILCGQEMVDKIKNDICYTI